MSGRPGRQPSHGSAVSTSARSWASVSIPGVLRARVSVAGRLLIRAEEARRRRWRYERMAPTGLLRGPCGNRPAQRRDAPYRWRQGAHTLAATTRQGGSIAARLAVEQIEAGMSPGHADHGGNREIGVGHVDIRAEVEQAEDRPSLLGRRRAPETARRDGRRRRRRRLGTPGSTSRRSSAESSGSCVGSPTSSSSIRRRS